MTDRRANHVLICDLGNVLVGFDRSRTYRRIAEATNTDVAFIEGAIERSEIRPQYELGDTRFADEMDFLRALRHVLRRAGIKDEIPLDVIKRAWNDIFWENTDVTRTVRHLKFELGVPLILLSDTNPLHYQYLRNTFPHIHELFDVEVLSFLENLSKERHAENILGVAIREARRLMPGISSENILYVDDMREFIDAGRSLGLSGHVFDGADDLMDWLETRGLAVPP